MPQIITSPVDLFQTPVAPVGALLPRQANPALPTGAALASATGMLLPQADLARSMAHFPDTVYDVRPTSHLSRFLAALLGDAGAGQLRKRQLVARTLATLSGPGFLDQDRFYGAVFSMGRTLAEQLPVDPADSLATVEEWEELEASDAAYRERIVALAATIPLAGTLPGLIAAASAIIGAPVEATETWRLLDAGAATPARTWGDVEALGNWSALEGQRWFVIENVFTIGLSGVNSRAEVVIRPHKDYPAGRDGQVAAAADAKALSEVLSKLTPDGILITVDNAVAAPGTPVPIAALWADSEYTQIVPKVTVAASIPAADATACYPLSAQQSTAGLDPAATRYLPVPYGVNTAGASWDFNAAVTATTSYSYTTSDPPDTPGTGTPVPGDDQVLTWRDGATTVYAADQAVASPSLAAAARLGSPGHLAAHPWSGARKAVPVHA